MGYVDAFERSKAPPLIAELPEFNQGTRKGLSGLHEERHQPAPVLKGLPVRRETEHVAPIIRPLFPLGAECGGLACCPQHRAPEERWRWALQHGEGLPGTGNAQTPAASGGPPWGGVRPSSQQVVRRTAAHHELWWFYFNGNIFCFHFYLHLVIKINVFS